MTCFRPSLGRRLSLLSFVTVAVLTTACAAPVEVDVVLRGGTIYDLSLIHI